MPLVRVSDPVHQTLISMGQNLTRIRGRQVSVSEVLEILIRNYTETAEKESEDDN